MYVAKDEAVDTVLNPAIGFNYFLHSRSKGTLADVDAIDLSD